MSKMEVEDVPSKPAKKGAQEEISTKKQQRPKTKHNPCKYGDKCYTKGDEHANKFSHPCKYGDGCYRYRCVFLEVSKVTRKDDSHFERFNHPWDFEKKGKEDENEEKVQVSMFLETNQIFKNGNFQ